MASQLASFPNLRRTLTDVLEDELYPIASHNTSSNSASYYDYEPQTTNIHQYPEYKDNYPFQTYANPDLYTTFPQYQFQSMLNKKHHSDSEAPSTFHPIDAHLKLPAELMTGEDLNLYETSGDPLFVFPKDGVVTMDHDFMNVVPDEVLDEELSEDDEDDYISDDDEDEVDGVPQIQRPRQQAQNQVEMLQIPQQSQEDASGDAEMSEDSSMDMDMSEDGKKIQDHKCKLINQATGKPCLKEFSRPYDLIRHQETIHAQRKKIFRCIVCEAEAKEKREKNIPFSHKTFSRGDALSRHIKVKHGLMGTAATEAIKYAKDNVEYV